MSKCRCKKKLSIRLKEYLKINEEKIRSAMNIFVFNCGSSSLKFKMISMPSGEELFGGEVQRIASKTSESSRIVYEAGGKEEVYFEDIKNHMEAFSGVMKIIEEKNNAKPDLFAHRLVKGGAEIINDSLLDESTFYCLDELKELAPIHNPPIIEVIKACRIMYPSIAQALVLDTSFHSTIPDYAYTYALPDELCSELGIKKYGFHGISHRFVSEEAAKYLNIPVEKFNAVSCHLGSGGASLCAVKNGKSIDNSMGFSPLQGLVMSTRCGNLDPAVLLKMLAYEEGNFSKVDKILNKKSGVLGLSGISSDIRDVIEAKSNDEKLEITFDIYLWRIKKYLGSYLTLLGKTDAIIFTDTIGETVPLVRESVCKNLDYFGIKLDEIKNKQVHSFPCDISLPGSKIRILVVKTNEELSIAKRAYRLMADKDSPVNTVYELNI